MITADEAKATLEFLVPGFVALKTFYVLALRTRRSDLEWTLLSVAAAALLNFPVEHWLGVTDPGYRAVDATVLGVAIALVLAAVWPKAEERWGHLFRRQAWDAAFSRGRWVSVWVKDGPIVLGWAKSVSDSADTDDLDVYLLEPVLIDRATNKETEVPTVRGIWVSADQIELLQVIRDDRDPPPLERGR